MKIHITLTEKDYIDFNICHAFHSEAGRNALKKIRMSAPIVSAMALAIFFILSAEKAMIIGEAIVLAIVCIVFYVMAPKMLVRNIRKGVENLKKDGKLPFHEHADVTFHDEYLEEEYDGSRRIVKYVDMTSIFTDEEHLYLMVGSGLGMIFPYECLGDQRKDLELLLKHKTGLEF